MEGTHHNAIAAELKQVEPRDEDLLKELQLLEDQNNDVSSQESASGKLLQQNEHEVIDLHGQINMIMSLKW